MRILVATVTAGGGHLQAAAALEEAWKTTCPSDEVKRVDLLDLVPKVQRQFYADAYIKLVEHAPELYDSGPLLRRHRRNPGTARRARRTGRAGGRHRHSRRGGILDRGAG
ncbi:MAG TPA: hypothetical protein VNZ26_10085 [Vicinamibacterales bacterium]|nr:hypothetical protein [Vicinamibacterales bacterium]